MKPEEESGGPRWEGRPQAESADWAAEVSCIPCSQVQISAHSSLAILPPHPPIPPTPASHSGDCSPLLGLARERSGFVGSSPLAALAIPWTGWYKTPDPYSLRSP